jgi:hemerythrin-like domain-containing protein
VAARILNADKMAQGNRIARDICGVTKNPQNLFGCSGIKLHRRRSSFLMTRCVTDYLVQENQTLSLLLNELHEQLGVLRLARDRHRTTERLTGIQRKIAQALHTHVAEEEQILYPALEESVQGITFTLDRMRQEHDLGEQSEKTFNQSLDRLVKGKGNPQEVMQNGRKYIGWLRNHLMVENGRLFPMVDRGLDAATQQAARRAMEDFGKEPSTLVAEALPQAAHA